MPYIPDLEIELSRILGNRPRPTRRTYTRDETAALVELAIQNEQSRIVEILKTMSGTGSETNLAGAILALGKEMDQRKES